MAYRQIPIPPGSSNVESVEFDDAAGKLKIIFQRSSTPYFYDGVDGNTADGFTTSGLSAGNYFRARILNQYPFTKG
jgi:hypothetical protein